MVQPSGDVICRRVRGLTLAAVVGLLAVGCTAGTGTRSPSSTTPTSTSPVVAPTTAPASTGTSVPVPVTGSIAHQSLDFPPSGVVKTTIFDSTGDYPAFEIGWDTAGKYLVVILRDSGSYHPTIERVTKTGEQTISITTSPPPPPQDDVHGRLGRVQQRRHRSAGNRPQPPAAGSPLQPHDTHSRPKATIPAAISAARPGGDQLQRLENSCGTACTPGDTAGHFVL